MNVGEDFIVAGTIVGLFIRSAGVQVVANSLTKSARPLSRSRKRWPDNRWQRYGNRHHRTQGLVRDLRRRHRRHPHRDTAQRRFQSYHRKRHKQPVKIYLPLPVITRKGIILPNFESKTTP